MDTKKTMRIRQHILEIFDALTTDESLLRLLYYPSKNLMDDPLDSNKTDILSMDRREISEIIDDRVKFTPNTDALDESKKCRICYYAGDRRKTANKYSMDQEVVFDVITHRHFQETDLRLYRIVERIDYIIKNSNFSAFGEVAEVDGHPFSVNEEYLGYRVIYEFGELNDR